MPNTLKRPCARLLPDNWETRTYNWVPWTGCALRGTAITLFYGPISCICWCPVSPAMPVWPVAQRPVCVLPSPSSFMNLLWLLSSLLGFLLPSSCIWVNRYCSLYPLGLLIHHVVLFIGCPLLLGKHGWWPSRLFSGSLAESIWLFLLHLLSALCRQRLWTLTFSFLFWFGLYLFILREVTKRVPF